MNQFTHRELYLAAALAALTALILYAVHYWKARERRWDADDAELARTQTFLAGLHDPELTLRRTRPHGQLILDEQSWKGGRLILRPPDGVNPEAPWALMALCTLQCWRDDVAAEISRWPHDPDVMGKQA